MDASQLVATVDGMLFAIPARCVVEIARVSALAPVLGASSAGVMGTADVRGRTASVLDLRHRLGLPASPPVIEDEIVFLEDDGRLVGLLVDDVLDLRDIPPDAVEVPPAQVAADGLVVGLARTEAGLVRVLDVAALVHASGAPPGRAAAPPARWTPDQEDVLRARAAALAQRLEAGDEDEGRAVAIVGLSGERYAVDLRSLREFLDVQHVTPVPCAPQHVIGCLNLRGDILTLLDVRPSIGLPVGSRASVRKAIVVEAATGPVAVVVDEVVDVARLRASAERPLPAGNRGAAAGALVASATIGGSMLTLIDINRILDSGDLTVDEEV